MAEKEYIAKEFVIDAIEELKTKPMPKELLFDHLTKLIEIFPTEDFAPVKHGHWDTISDSDMSKTVMCSVCNKMFYFTKKRAQLNIDKMPHCPNCGSRMGGEIK